MVFSISAWVTPSALFFARDFPALYSRNCGKGNAGLPELILMVGQFVMGTN